DGGAHGCGVPEAAGVPLQRLERAEQSTLWITASEDGASATCVGVAPACKELRSGPNKSEREPTSARSTNYGSGHLIPAFHGTGRTFSLLPSHPLDAGSRSIDAPLVSCLRGKVPRPKIVSSNQKRFQLCFVRNSPRGTSEPRVFHPKREPRRSPPRWGAGSREPSFGGVRRATRRDHARSYGCMWIDPDDGPLAVVGGSAWGNVQVMVPGAGLFWIRR